MALTLGDNFSYMGAKPLDARLKYSTVAAMKAMADSTLYDGCLAYCAATDKTYQWKSTNTVDETLGRWREFSSGGSSITVDDALSTTSENPVQNKIITTALNKNYEYAISSTAASTAAKTATLGLGSFNLTSGARVCVKFTQGNTAFSPTLNVDFTGAKSIKYIDSSGTVQTPTSWWGAGDVVTFVYDGTRFLMQPALSMGGGSSYTAGDGIDITNNEISTDNMPAADMSEVISPLPGVMSRRMKYSTEEQVVGEWIDGKPIYQKTTIVDTTSATQDNLLIDSSPNNEYISAVGYGLKGNNVIFIPYFTDGTSNYAFLYFNKASGTNYDYLRMTCKLPSSGYRFYITAQYTKTTD